MSIRKKMNERKNDSKFKRIINIRKKITKHNSKLPPRGMNEDNEELVNVDVEPILVGSMREEDETVIEIEQSNITTDNIMTEEGSQPIIVDTF